MKLVELAYFTENVEAMTNFYRSLFGTEPVARSEGMAIFMSGETKILIHYKSPASPISAGELPPENHVAFGVQDVDAVCEELVKQGLTLEVPPKDYYWGRSAYLRNPDGFLVEITRG